MTQCNARPHKTETTKKAELMNRPKAFDFSKLLIAGYAAAAALLVSGCAITPPEIPENIDYGRYPTNYEQRIANYMQGRLKDPESARYKFQEPVTAYVSKGPFGGGGVKAAGWKVNFELNAKNGFGGYVGYKPYFALFVDDELWRVVDWHSAPDVITTHKTK